MLKVFSHIFQLIFISVLMIYDNIRGRKIIILMIEELGFAQYILPIVKSLKKKSTLPISFYISVDCKLNKDELHKFRVSNYKIFNSTINQWLLLTDIFLSPSIYPKGPKSAIKVNISHNLPVKWEAYPRESVINYDVHFLTGPTQRDQYETMLKKFEIDLKNVTLLDVGYPKLDEIFNRDFSKETIIRKLGLDTGKQTVLYAPAWDPGASLRSFGEQVIEELIKVDDVNIIVKLHPVSYTTESHQHFDFYTGGVDWIKFLSKYDNNHNFRHISEYSLNPLLIACDVMVSDISSAALEFMLLDKPVIFIDCPEFFNKTLKQWNQNPDLIKKDIRYNAGRNAGIVVKNLPNLKDAVTRCFENPNEFSKKRKALSSQILYNPGMGSQVSAEKILELLELN